MMQQSLRKHELYPVINRLSDLLSLAFNGCNSTIKQARLGGAGNDCDNWLVDYDHGKPEATYLAGFHAICEALDAFEECGYSVDTSDVWMISHAD